MLSGLLPKRRRAARTLVDAVRRGAAFAESPAWARGFPAGGAEPTNDLSRFFDGNREGPGIWKWRHYFEIYDRHLSRFRGHAPRVAEIGVYSGGSLAMWRDYFGEGAEIHGIDIEPACEVYAGEGVSVHIGDQADRGFWRGFRSAVPAIDVLIDDGGHLPEQQIVTLEEMLPNLAPGGVYICEDVHGHSHRFAEMVYGLAGRLNDMAGCREAPDDPERRLSVSVSGATGLIKGISLYPFVVVIELNPARRETLVAPKHGTQWEPFLK